MAKKLKVGDVLHGYRITRVFGPGMMAISYAAQRTRSGEQVFFKQYKSPAPSVVWYAAFVAYQKELSARVREGTVGHYAVRQLDAFEEAWGGRCYFQTYEFVENGADLQQVLDREREQHRETRRAPTADPAVWARHVTWAKVLVAAIAALHEARIAHADLKPANAYLVEDPTIGAGYQLKLIDMDFSLLVDRRAPWHGHQGYIGSDNYRSPEHLVKGGVPGTASDVFTCGLMLYELLAGEHPYWREDQTEYARLAQGHAARPPALAGTLPSPALNADVSAALHRCLAPDPSVRPTAAELRAVLSGRGAAAVARAAAASAAGAAKLGRGDGTGTATGVAPRRPVASGTAATAATGSTGGAVPPTPGPRRGPAETHSTAAPVAQAPSRPAPSAGRKGDVAPLSSERIELRGPDGRALQIGVRTELGKSLVRAFGAEAEFWDERQCVVERQGGRQWVVSPVAGAVNETLLNGQTLAGPRALCHGDQIAVGRQARGLVKLPLTVVESA